MAYIVNNSRGQIVAVVGDGTVNTSATDLALIGRAVTNFGDFQNENFVYLLENFASPAAPTQPSKSFFHNTNSIKSPWEQTFFRHIFLFFIVFIKISKDS